MRIANTRYVSTSSVAFNGDGQYMWVRKDVYVRAIAIDNGKKKIVLIVSEVGVANIDSIKDRITIENGINKEDLLICSSHNHSCPGPIDLDQTGEWGTSFPPELYKYSEYVLEKTIAVAGEALNNMRPARYGYGKGNSYINVSRDEQLNDGRWIFGRNFERPSDKTLAILKLEDLSGKMIAVIMNYAVHSTMCFRVKDKNGHLCVSGDLAGEITDFMEEAYKEDGAVVAWTIAAGGNQTPILEFFHVYHPDGTYEPDERYNRFLDPFMWDMCAHLGQKQGMDALKIINGITTLRDHMKIEIIEKELQLTRTKVEGFGVQELLDDRLIDDRKIHNVDIDGTMDLTLKLVTLGDIALFGVNFEFMCESGIRVKESSPLKELIIITCCDKMVKGAPYLVDKWGYENHTPSYYRNGVRDAMTEEAVIAAMLEMFDERLKEDNKINTDLML